MPARAFLAIDPSAAVRDTLANVQSALRGEDPRWLDEKWVRAELLHVTVRFIGALPDARTSDLLDRLRRVLAAQPSFDLQLHGLRAVPNSRRASMVWATLESDPNGFTGLRRGVDEAISSALGMSGESRSPSPHVTLVRARRPHRLDATALDTAGTLLMESGKDRDRIVSVRTITLYASTLGPSGPTYDRIGEVALGPTGREGAD